MQSKLAVGGDRGGRILSGFRSLPINSTLDPSVHGSCVPWIPSSNVKLCLPHCLGLAPPVLFSLRHALAYAVNIGTPCTLHSVEQVVQGDVFCNRYSYPFPWLVTFDSGSHPLTMCSSPTQRFFFPSVPTFYPFTRYAHCSPDARWLGIIP